MWIEKKTDEKPHNSCVLFSSSFTMLPSWLIERSRRSVQLIIALPKCNHVSCKRFETNYFLRLRASEAKRRSLYCSAFTSVLVFFSRDIPSAFVLIEGYFLRAYFSATIQTFQKETQLDALSNRVKTFRKFSTGAILLASKARNFRKFLGFLSILLFFFSQTTANWPDVGTNRRKTMFSLIWWKFFYPRIIGLCENDH